MSATTHNKDTQESWFLSRVGHSHINTSKLDQMEVYVEVQQLVDGLPASCLYALPERPHAGKSIITAPSIGHLLGLLAVMLDEKAQRCRADAHVMSRAAPSGPATSSCEQGGDSSHEFRVCYARDGLFKRALVMQTPNKRLLGLHAINWLLNPAAPDCVSATASDTFSTSIPDSSTSTPGCSTSIPDSSTSTPGSFTSTSWSSSAAAVQGPSLCSAHILELTRKSSSSSCTQQLPPLHLLPSVLAQYRHWPRATQSSVSDAVSVTLACLAQR